MNLLKLVFILCYFILPWEVYAQDSTNVVNDPTEEVKKTKFVFGFDARYSSIHNQSVRINGLKLGWERFGKNRYGIGIYSLRNPIPINNSQTEAYNLDTINITNLMLQSDLSYLVFFWDHILVSKKRHEISVNMEFGSGSAQLEYLDEVLLNEDGTPFIHVLSDVPFNVLELNFSGHYKILPWIGPGAGFGYRYVFSDDKNVSKAFSGFIGIIKVKIFIGPIYRAVFPKKKK